MNINKENPVIPLFPYQKTFRLLILFLAAVLTIQSNA